MKDVSAMGNQFRKKPVVIEAEQFGRLSPEFSEICCMGTGNCPTGPDEWHIHTLEGPMLISEGDWIIKGIKGEFYPCKPDIFAATYEPANLSAPVQPGPRPQLYVISVTGDGGQTTIVPEDKLKQALHEAYCSCGKDWQKCSDEVITNTIAKLDDPEEWTQNYPTYERHIWLDHGEDYTVQVMRVSSVFPVAAPSATPEPWIRRCAEAIVIHAENCEGQIGIDSVEGFISDYLATTQGTPEGK